MARFKIVDDDVTVEIFVPDFVFKLMTDKEIKKRSHLSLNTIEELRYEFEHRDKRPPQLQ